MNTSSVCFADSFPFKGKPWVSKDMHFFIHNNILNKHLYRSKYTDHQNPKYSLALLYEMSLTILPSIFSFHSYSPF